MVKKRPKLGQKVLMKKESGPFLASPHGGLSAFLEKSGISPVDSEYVLVGERIYDPRTDSSVVSANPALIFLDLLADAHGIPAPDLLSGSLKDLRPWIIRMADFCDEQVDAPSGFVLS